MSFANIVFVDKISVLEKLKDIEEYRNTLISKSVGDSSGEFKIVDYIIGMLSEESSKFGDLDIITLDLKSIEFRDSVISTMDIFGIGYLTYQDFRKLPFCGTIKNGEYHPECYLDGILDEWVEGPESWGNNCADTSDSPATHLIKN